MQSPATTVIRRGLLRLLAQARNDTAFCVILFSILCHSERSEESLRCFGWRLSMTNNRLILPSIAVILSEAKNLMRCFGWRLSMTGKSA